MIENDVLFTFVITYVLRVLSFEIAYEPQRVFSNIFISNICII